jgi:hypothetical protein
MDILSLVLRPIVSLFQIASSGPSRSDAPASPFQALHLLSRILPREICFSILDYAELWTKTSVSRADSCSVREHTPREAYVSLPIPNRNKLRTIVFKTRSHDQGS